jgi:hypothetical protein
VGGRFLSVWYGIKENLSGFTGFGILRCQVNTTFIKINPATGGLSVVSKDHGIIQ